MRHVLQEKKRMLPATLNSLTTLSHALRQFLAPLQLSEGWIYPLDLALCEAASNIILHGYGENASQTYRVRFHHEGGDIRVTLCDTGTAVPSDKLDARAYREQHEDLTLETLSEGGRGWALIFESVDRVDYQRDGKENRLTLWRALPPELKGN